MEVTVCDNVADGFGHPVGTFPGVGTEGHPRLEVARTCFSVEIYSEPGMDWHDAVRWWLKPLNSSLELCVSAYPILRNALFLGGPFFVAIFQLPQRSQIVAGVSPLMAGVRLLPFTVSAPLGSIMASIVAGKAKIPPIYLVIGASSLQVIGFALLSTLPSTNRTLQAQYGYEVIAGLGCGVNISTLMLMTPFSVEKKDQGMLEDYSGKYHGLLTLIPSRGAKYRNSISRNGWRDRPSNCDHSPEQLCQI